MKKTIIKILAIVFTILMINVAIIAEFSSTEVKDTKTIKKVENILSTEFINRMKATLIDVYDNEVDIVISSTESTIRDSDIFKSIYRLHKKPSYEQLKSHIVYITGIVPDKKYDNYMIERGSSWIGTGFVFKVSDKYTWIITNKHVAGIFANKEEETTELYIGDTKEERVKAKIVRFHPKYDVALLMVYGKLKGKIQVKGLSTAKPQDKVYLVGHHLGRQYIYGEGVFAGYQE